MYDMTIRLQTDSGKRLYEQIYEHIKKEIREGKLLTGERLPSTRSLAEYLQVARSTVEYAYDQLVSEGYIEARPYKGYFVCPLEELFLMEGERSEEGIKAFFREVSPFRPEEKPKRRSRGRRSLFLTFRQTALICPAFPLAFGKELPKTF